MWRGGLSDMGMTMQMVAAPPKKKQRNFTMSPNSILWSKESYGAIIGILRFMHKCPKHVFHGSIRKLSRVLCMAKSTVHRLLPVWKSAGWVTQTGEDPTMVLELQMDQIWALNAATVVASTDSTDDVLPPEEEETTPEAEDEETTPEAEDEETTPEQPEAEEEGSSYTNGYQGAVVESNGPAVPKWDTSSGPWETPVPNWDRSVPEWDGTVPNWDKTVPCVSSNRALNITYNIPFNTDSNITCDVSSDEEDATVLTTNTLLNLHFAERHVLEFFGYHLQPMTDEEWSCTPPDGSTHIVTRAWIIQEAERVRTQTTQSPVPSVQEQEEHTRGVKLTLTPEQKAHARALKAVIEGQCGKLAKRGANIAENKAVARLVTRYEDTDLLDVLHYLRHIHWKHSKPDNKYKIRGYVLEEEIEAVLRVFAENPDLRTATELPTAPTRRRSTRTVAEPPAAAPTQQAEAGMKQAEAEALAATARQQAEAQGRQITVTPTKEGEAWVITVDWQTPPLKLATIRSLQHWQDLFVDICRIWQRTAARKEVTHHG